MSSKWQIILGGLFFIGVIARIFTGEGANESSATTDSHESSVTTDFPEDKYGLALLKDLYAPTCDKIEEANVFDRIRGTASANNHPAYVLGYNFKCMSNFGNDNIKIYIGFMENKNNSQLECIHHNADKSLVISDGWYACGGNFRQN